MGHPHYKELIFKSLQYLFIIKQPEKHKTITPNSGRPIFLRACFCVAISVAENDRMMTIKRYSLAVKRIWIKTKNRCKTLILQRLSLF